MSSPPPTFRETVELRDGSTADLRPVQPADAEGLQALFNRLSPESVYFRFLEARKELPLKQAQQFATVDYRSSMAVLAVVTEGDIERIIGVARYGTEPNAPEGENVADAAVVVEDAYQGRGLGTILLLRLVQYASENGIHALHATVHQSNARILHFIRKSGLQTDRHLDGGVWDITVNLEDLDELPGI